MFAGVVGPVGWLGEEMQDSSGGAFLKLLGALFGVLAGCASVGAPSSADESFAATVDLDDYVLGPSDKVRVIVFQEPELSGEYAINPKGEISYPLLGAIPVAGLTLQEFRDQLAEQLASGYINDPSVAAEIVEYRPFYIYGEVEAPGEFPYVAAMSVTKAVAAAGGFTYRARRSHVFIKRADANDEEKVKLTPDLMVYPGDVVRIGERFF